MHIRVSKENVLLAEIIKLDAAIIEKIIQMRISKDGIIIINGLLYESLQSKFRKLGDWGILGNIFFCIQGTSKSKLLKIIFML